MRGIFIATFVAAFFMIAVPSLMAEDPLNIDETGIVVVLPETVIFEVSIANGSYWEPFTDTFGDGTCVVIAGVHGIDGSGNPMSDTMNAKVCVIQPDGSYEEYWAFTDDEGNTYTGNFNVTRPSGNPPRVCCDRRDGVYRFCVGQEATPWNFGEFTTDRWFEPFLFDAQHPACQLYELTASGPVALTNVFDGLYGGIDGSQNGAQMRFGGDMRFLSNGNLMICPEDRSGNTVSGNGAVFAIYDGATGARITEPRSGRADGSTGEIWSNCAAFDGGFALRVSGVISTFDNDGNVMGSVGLGDVTSVNDMGRADDSRIAANINHEFIYICGKDADSQVVVTKINALTLEEVNEVVVTEEFFFDYGGQPHRTDCSTDENGNVIVWWDYDIIPSYTDAVARIFNSDLEPLGKSFYCYTNHNSDAEGDLGFYSHEGSVTMDNERIIVASNGITLSPGGGFTADEQTYITMYENPLRVSVNDWELY